MPYEEDKLQDMTEEEEHDKKREKKKPLVSSNLKSLLLSLISKTNLTTLILHT